MATEREASEETKELEVKTPKEGDVTSDSLNKKASVKKPNEETLTKILNFVLDSRRESYETRLTVEPYWDEGWSLYQNEWDFSDKESWQSQLRSPVFGNLVDSGSEAFKRAIASAFKYFRIEASDPTNEVEKRLAAFFTELTREQLKKAMIFRVLSGALKNAWITNYASIRVTFDDSLVTLPMLVVNPEGGTEVSSREVSTNTLKLKDIDPYFHFPDPTGRKLYEIYEFYMDKYALLEMANEEDGFFNLEELEELEGSEDSSDGQFSKQKSRIQQESVTNASRKQLLVTEFWGTLLNPNGKVLLRNARVYIIENKVVIYVDKIPYFDGKAPFVNFNLLHQTDAIWGKSYSQAAASICREEGYSQNLTADGMRYATLKAFGVDVSVLEDLDILTRGIHPGAVIPSRSGNAAIQQLNFAGPGGEVITWLHMLKDAAGNAMNAHEFVTGAPSSRGRTSATEVDLKMGRSGELLESMALDLEQAALQPLLEKAFYRIIESLDFNVEPGVRGMLKKYGLPETLFAELDQSQRAEFLGPRFRFIVSGLATQITRMFIVENIMQFLQVVGNLGDMAQPFAPQIQLMIQRMIDLLGIDAETLVSPPSMGGGLGAVSGQVGGPPGAQGPQGPSMPLPSDVVPPGMEGMMQQ